ncbi:hypothetical protein WEU41_17125 [Pseudomonas fragi]|uniref:hypothetical protein n=1 Tax=Pseudomonas fragi TaxID=296 RepID=UPI0030B61160
MKRIVEYLLSQAEWWCSRSLEWWAAHITAVYIGGAVLVMGGRFEELMSLKLNEIGDLSAGIFGPVAFFWLVLGYVQQGRELKLSSQALATQAEELRASVAQQMELVKATNRTLENHENSLEPLLQIRFKEIVAAYNEDGHVERHRFSIENSGAYCEHIKIFIVDESETLVARFSSFAAASEKVFSVDDLLNADKLFSIKVSYFKANGNSGFQVFGAWKAWDEGWWISINKKIHGEELS